jgi:hypothetical protein
MQMCFLSATEEQPSARLLSSVVEVVTSRFSTNHCTMKQYNSSCLSAATTPHRRGLYVLSRVGGTFFAELLVSFPGTDP